MIKIPATPEGIPADSPDSRRRSEHHSPCSLRSRQSKSRSLPVRARSSLRKGPGHQHTSPALPVLRQSHRHIVDSKIDEKLKTLLTIAKKPARKHPRKIAIANARLTYKKYQELFAAPRWKALAPKARRPAPPLGQHQHKNPKYADVIYVEELIARIPSTPFLRPPLDAFRDHGKLRPSLTENVEGAAKTMAISPKPEISMKEVRQLLVDGVKLFADASGSCWTPRAERRGKKA